MLPVLYDSAQLQSEPPYKISVRGLVSKLSFWTVHDLQRVVKSLSDKGMIQLLSPPLTQTDVMSFTLDAGEVKTTQKKAALPATVVEQPQPQSQRGANRISPTWQPNATVLAQLAQLGITAQFARQQVVGFVTYWCDRNEISHSWSAKFLKHVTHEWQRSRADVHFLQATNEPGSMQQSWKPSEDALEILLRTGIDANFIEDAVPEFVLYWRERGDAASTWNSKFIQHIRRQWASYTSTLKHDTEPRRIPANWQPTPEVFEILVMANIDGQFAQNCLQEFILYWKDSNKLYSSWNTKFLQHVKYCWANQHQLQRLNHEGQQNTSGSGAGSTSSFVAKHTDRSWADSI